MITLVARWIVKPGQMEAVLDLMAPVISESRKEPGNLLYDLYVDPVNKSAVLIHEKYRDENAVEAHRATEHFQKIVIPDVLPLLAKRELDVYTKVET